MHPPRGEETPCCNKVSSAPPPSPSPLEPGSPPLRSSRGSLPHTPPLPPAPRFRPEPGGRPGARVRVRPERSAPGPMDSAAVITQISKEEARGPLRGKGTGRRGAGGTLGAAARVPPRPRRPERAKSEVRRGGAWRLRGGETEAGEGSFRRAGRAPRPPSVGANGAASWRGLEGRRGVPVRLAPHTPGGPPR